MGSNNVGYVQQQKSGSPFLDALLMGYKWSGSHINYSFPDAYNDYPSSYNYDADKDGYSAQYDGFYSVNSSQVWATQWGLEDSVGGGYSVEGFTNLTISYAGYGNGDGTIRIAGSNDAGNSAYAFPPSSGSPYGGDVWFGPKMTGYATQGTWHNVTILHELGHALGLKHGHESTSFGPALPAAYDSLEYSIMTYRPHAYANYETTTYAEGHGPQSFMMFDIRALQHMYGADFSTNSGDTTYSWNPNNGQAWTGNVNMIAPSVNVVFHTIWDGGGNDTYNLSNYTSNLIIDLTPGSYSNFGMQRANLGGVYAKGNVFNAMQYGDDNRSLIENAIGGSGNDWIRGNHGHNHLRGGAGNDRLIGGDGVDWLQGDAGNDVFEFASLADSRADNPDYIIGFGNPGAYQGDVIDLSKIDANTAASGDQAFYFSSSYFGNQGLYAVDVSGGYTELRGNVDNDNNYEFALRVSDGDVRAASYTAQDFFA